MTALTTGSQSLTNSSASAGSALKTLGEREKSGAAHREKSEELSQPGFLDICLIQAATPKSSAPDFALEDTSELTASTANGSSSHPRSFHG